MSGVIRKNLEELITSIKKNFPKVQGKVSAMGGRPNRAIVISTAKYYKALDKLAQE